MMQSTENWQRSDLAGLDLLNGPRDEDDQRSAVVTTLA